MKFACASSAFHRAFESGDLTQLEFLDAAAHVMAYDGVVLDDRHFPRTDSDYLAQVKKTATDLGLCIAALASDAFFAATPDEMRAALDCALALGTPLLTGRLGGETTYSWSDQLGKLGVASSLAKSANVTLALRNAPHTFAATSHDCKRVTKETDSAWLRYGLEPAAFDAASDPLALAPKTVLLWRDAQSAQLTGWEQFRGFVALDDVDGGATVENFKLNRT
jgi:sugar phosphate isomerase/epimerase